jgi:hypothetical protein
VRVMVGKKRGGGGGDFGSGFGERRGDSRGEIGWRGSRDGLFVRAGKMTR